MELRISARNLTVSERFKEYVSDKSGKVSQLAHKPQELNIKITRHEHRSAGVEDQVELTVYVPGHVVRAEARSNDKFSAFDMALSKLLERLRRASDKQKIHRGGGHKNLGVSELTAADFAQIDIKPIDIDAPDVAHEHSQAPVPEDYSPVVIRSKEFEAESMSPEDAVTKMELVGHDFFLFIDSATSRPSVVYRRKGWNYGLISLSQ
jgi:ribosomal subunit interface protein